MVSRSLPLILIRLCLIYSFRVQQTQHAASTNDRLPLAFQGHPILHDQEISAQRHGRHSNAIAMEELAKRYPGKQEFSLKQYNVLAAWKGDNAHPGMLQGAAVSREQRKAIWKKFDNNDESWKDELTEEQWRRVRLQNDTVFNWDARKVLLLKEMFADNPDILTLQDLDMYSEFFKPAFQERNYGSLRAKRIGKEDGVAIVFNQHRFRLLAKSKIFHLPNEADHTPVHHPGSNSTVTDDVKENITHKARSMRDRGGYGEHGGRIAVFALLQDRANPWQKVMVGTTHLDKGPENPLKSLSRIKQMSVLNVIQEHLAKKWGVSLDSDIVIMAGDLNTDMHEESMVKKPALAGADYRMTKMTIPPLADRCTTMTENRNMWIDYIFHAGQAEVIEAHYPSCTIQPIPNLNHGSDHFSVTAKLRWTNSSDAAYDFTIPKTYNYSQSTEDNYAAGEADEAQLVGEFTEVRKVIDYAYHRVYQKERQLLQDRVVRKFLDAATLGSHFDVACESPMSNWIVFTAGGMGSGKSYTLAWLRNQTYFPLNAFVYVDPDEIRAMLPESERYLKTDGSTYGILTQKEAGYMAEILIGTSLQQDKPVLVDGSLREYEWYLKYFGILRKTHPELKIGIIHVHASIESQYARMQARARKTGRVIPEQLMEKTTHLINKSLGVLVPHSDFFASIDNEGAVPRLSSLLTGAYDGARSTDPAKITWENFREAWEEQFPSLLE